MKKYIKVAEIWWVQDFLQYSKGHNSETRKGGDPFLSMTHRLHLMYIPTNLYEYIMNKESVMGCTIK